MSCFQNLYQRHIITWHNQKYLSWEVQTQMHSMMHFHSISFNDAMMVLSQTLNFFLCEFVKKVGSKMLSKTPINPTEVRPVEHYTRASAWLPGNGLQPPRRGRPAGLWGHTFGRASLPNSSRKRPEIRKHPDLCVDQHWEEKDEQFLPHS